MIEWGFLSRHVVAQCNHRQYMEEKHRNPAKGRKKRRTIIRKTKGRPCMSARNPCKRKQCTNPTPAQAHQTTVLLNNCE